jgi:hypothetical protein
MASRIAVIVMAVASGHRRHDGLGARQMAGELLTVMKKAPSAVVGLSTGRGGLRGVRNAQSWNPAMRQCVVVIGM